MQEKVKKSDNPSPWDLLEGGGSHQPMDTTQLSENFPADQQYSLGILFNATTLQGPLSFLFHCHQAIIYPIQSLCTYFFPLWSLELRALKMLRYYESLEKYYFVHRNWHLVNEIIFITIESRVNNYTAKRNLKLLSPRFSLPGWRHRKR